MLKIAVFQNDLGVGGIQKSLVNLLSNLDYSRVQVDLYLSVRGEFWPVSFPKELNIRYLSPTPRFYSFVPFDLARRCLRYDFPAEFYDLAIDFNSYQCSCAVGATTVPAKRRVMWIHNNVEIKLRDEWKYRVLWHFFKGKFKYYDDFVPVSRALGEPFRHASGVTGKPFTVIQNYIDVTEIRRKEQEEPVGLSLDKSCLNFVALGRLCHQKGYDIMLDTFARACESRDDLRLYIIGDGPDRAALEAQAAERGISSKVTFLGNQPNPYCYMTHMDAFLSTSRYEGQPLNIMEAMAVGLPLYCSKNLEQYTEGLVGREDLVRALTEATREDKRPDDLLAYNRTILQRIEELAEN